MAFLSSKNDQNFGKVPLMMASFMPLEVWAPLEDVSKVLRCLIQRQTFGQFCQPIYLAEEDFLENMGLVLLTNLPINI